MVCALVCEATRVQKAFATCACPLIHRQVLRYDCIQLGGDIDEKSLQASPSLQSWLNECAARTFDWAVTVSAESTIHKATQRTVGHAMAKTSVVQSSNNLDFSLQSLNDSLDSTMDSHATGALPQQLQHRQQHNVTGQHDTTNLHNASSLAVARQMQFLTPHTPARYCIRDNCVLSLVIITQSTPKPL
jgi:hypothetical protein